MIIVDPPLSRIDVARIILGAVGIGLIVTGAVWALLHIAPGRYLDVALWAGAAVILHDGVLAPMLVAVGLLGHGAAVRVGPAAAAVARSALVVAACCSLVAIPGIVVRALGPRNATVHSVDYLQVLAVAWTSAVAIAITAAVAGLVQVRRARARTK